MKVKTCKLLILFICMTFFSCKAFTAEKIPYLIESSLVMEDSSDYEIAGLKLSFLNRSDKKVSEFTIVFYLFDEDGEPASFCRSNVVLTVKNEIDAGQKLEACLNLDSFFFYEPEVNYFADYVYISRIVYEDGTSWNDPFGLMVY